MRCVEKTFLLLFEPTSYIFIYPERGVEAPPVELTHDIDQNPFRQKEYLVPWLYKNYTANGSEAERRGNCLLRARRSSGAIRSRSFRSRRPIDRGRSRFAEESAGLVCEGLQELLIARNGLIWLLRGQINKYSDIAMSTLPSNGTVTTESVSFLLWHIL